MKKINVKYIMLRLVSVLTSIPEKRSAANGSKRIEDGFQGRKRVFDPLPDVRGLEKKNKRSKSKKHKSKEKNFEQKETKAGKESTTVCTGWTNRMEKEMDFMDDMDGRKILDSCFRRNPDRSGSGDGMIYEDS